MKLSTTAGTATLTLDDGRTFTTTSTAHLFLSVWQPIVCAPKDGTPVLITDGEAVEVGRYVGDGWLSSDGLDFGYGAWDDKLTLWAPIPMMPNVLAQGRLTAASLPAGVPLERRVGGGVPPEPTFEETMK